MPVRDRTAGRNNTHGTVVTDGPTAADGSRLYGSLTAVLTYYYGKLSKRAQSRRPRPRRHRQAGRARSDRTGTVTGPAAPRAAGPARPHCSDSAAAGPARPPGKLDPNELGTRPGGIRPTRRAQAPAPLRSQPATGPGLRAGSEVQLGSVLVVLLLLDLKFCRFPLNRIIRGPGNSGTRNRRGQS
eukprot:764587-Hanusia_phi.AAC.2